MLMAMKHSVIFQSYFSNSLLLDIYIVSFYYYYYFQRWNEFQILGHKSLTPFSNYVRGETPRNGISRSKG